MREHYQTEEEATSREAIEKILGEPEDGALSYGWTTYQFVAGILTVLVPYGYKNEEPRILLNENEGLYWEVPDA